MPSGTSELEAEGGRASSRRLLVFVRVPRIGQGMPLISAKLGEDAAYELQHQLLSRTVDEASRVPAVRRLVYTPDQPPVAETPGWTAVPQGGGDIGERLERAFQAAFQEGARTCVAIDMECPALTYVLLLHAFELLEGGKDVVLGPSVRGGYYLLGLSHPWPDLFQRMPWGSPQLFRTTLDRVLATGRKPEFLPRLGNIEEVADWKKAHDEGLLEVGPPPPPPPRKGGSPTSRFAGR